MIRTLPVDSARFDLIATGPATPAPQWAELSDGSRRPTGAQAKDDDGRLLWVVDCLAMAPGERDRAEVVGIQIASADEPAVTMLQPVQFDGLSVRIAKAKDGQLRTYWSADGVVPAGKRSSSPSSIPAPSHS